MRRQPLGASPDVRTPSTRTREPAGSTGQQDIFDLDLSHLRDLRTGIPAIAASPVVLWVAGDGGTPTVGPPLTVNGSPVTTSSPWSDSAGADIPIDVNDGSTDYYQQTTGDLDPGSTEDVVFSFTIETPADVSAQKTVFAQRDVTGGRGFQMVTSGDNFIVTIVGDSTKTMSFAAAASTLYHMTCVIGRNGNTIALWSNGVRVDTDTAPAGEIVNSIPFTLMAKSNGATRWGGKMLFFVEWQGVGIAAAWLADDDARVLELARLAMGIDATQAEAAPVFRCASARTWTDHNSTSWTVAAHLPRCGNTDGLTIDVDGGGGVEPEALWSGRHSVGVSGTYPRITGTRNASASATAAATQFPATLWILAGQSNARGNAFIRGDLAAGYEIPRGDVVEYHYLDDDGSPGAPYRPSLVEPLDGPGDSATRNIGVEPTMAIDLVTGGTRTVIVKAVRGSSALATVWDTARTTTPAMYAPMIDSTRRALGQTGATLAGMIWIQGEADATTEAYADAYAANLATFIAQTRADLNAPALDVLICRLRDGSTLTYKATVIAAQNAVIAADSNVHLVDCDAIDIQGDNVHYTDAGYQQLGKNIAAVILAL
jgi:lysophospholipase L1-like esterase